LDTVIFYTKDGVRFFIKTSFKKIMKQIFSFTLIFTLFSANFSACAEGSITASYADFQPITQEAPPPPAGEDPKSGSIPVNMAAFLKGLSGATQINEFSGGLGYGYDFWVPPGRGQMTPLISLTYNHQQKNYESFAGFGWSLNTHSIFRVPEKGVDKLYSKNNFASSFFGRSSELVLINEERGIYGTKSEEVFDQYQFVNGNWVVRDTRGWVYTFGADQSHRLENPLDSGQVYQWLLQKVEDRHGNFMKFSYFKEGGSVYPENIFYTGHGSDDGIYKIEFKRKSRIPYVEYKKGFKSENRYLLDSINVFFTGDGADQLIRTYEITHQNKHRAIRPISSIQVFEPEGSALPPMQFNYYEGGEGVQGSFPNLLSSIIQPEKGETRFYYKPSTTLKDNGLPFVLQTLWKVKSQTEPNNPWYETVYEYEGGHYFYDYENAFKKEYAGFHSVKITDPVGHFIKKYFHQSETSTNGSDKGEWQDHISKKGKNYRTEIYDVSGKLYQTQINRWIHTDLPENDPEKSRFFVVQSRSVLTDYEGGLEGKSQAKSYQYDAFGNIAEEIQYGAITLSDNAGNFKDKGTDKKIVSKKYAHNYDKHLHAFESETKVFDAQNNLTSHRQTFYDDLTFGKVEKGSLTKNKNWIADDQWSQATIKYNLYGLPIEQTNPRGFTSHTTYDDYTLLPQTQTNPLGHRTEMTYDYRFGKIETTTDPNGFKSQNLYDPFGRIQYEKISNPWSPANFLTLKTVQYDWQNYPIHITQRVYPQAGIEVVSRQYLDGFGRLIQVRSEQGDQYVVTQNHYEPRGHLSKITIPVLEPGLEYGRLDDTTVGTEYAYDGQSRLTSVIKPFSTRLLVYTPWKKQIINGKNIPKDFTFDAFGQLIETTEYLSGNPITTKYQWDNNGNLTKITDTAGNYKSFLYNGMRSLIEETQWTRKENTSLKKTILEYDENQNPIKITLPSGEIQTLTYDVLDRVLTEDFSQTLQIDTRYTYDLGNYALGKLTKVARDNYEKNLQYNLLGQIIEDEKILDQNSYSTQFTLNFLGQILEVIYPDGFKVNSFYGADGKLQKVLRGGETILSDLEYAPHGLGLKIVYGNGNVTENFYDASNLYRLQQKKTQTSGGNILQDLNYTYDAVNNLTQIEERASHAAKKVSNFTYDDLDRLTKTVVSGSGKNYTRDYRYDVIGNLTYRTDQGDFEYTGSHPHQVTSADGNILAYDANGNLVDNEVWTHTWNGKNQLISSTKKDGSKTMSYAYDENGIRWKKLDQTSGKETLYINDYVDIEDGVMKRYVFADTLKVAKVEGDAGATTGGGDDGGGGDSNIIVIDYGLPCQVPGTGDWTVTQNCYLSGMQSFDGNITVNPDATLSIMEDGVLDLDLVHKFVNVRQGGGLLIKKGGKLE
jgi:YD repeat-containing protein